MSPDHPKACQTLPNERWDQVAFRAYGNATYYRLIIDANTNIAEIFANGRVLASLPGGLTLTVPPKAPKANAMTLPPWRRGL